MIDYTFGEGSFENWIISENSFHNKYQGKCEAIMSLGNGYIGIRSSTEENYIGQTRNAFVAGTFNKFDEYEVTELPNAADQIEIEIWIDGVRFDVEKGKVEDYQRWLNFKTGELNRKFIWESHTGKKIAFHFARFVSHDNIHLFCSKMNIIVLKGDVKLELKSGINGKMTNSGSQHFHEGEKRIYDKEFLQMIQTTTESKIDFVHNTVHKLETTGDIRNLTSRFAMDRREVFKIYSAELKEGEGLTMEKISNIFTSRDIEGITEIDSLKERSLTHLQEAHKNTYDLLQESSASKLIDYWVDADVQIESENHFNQLAMRFALYHLKVMSPAHDNRCGIAAKGLSGEGYKGHSFWDTEIFILPFYTYTIPQIARSLLEYRYLTLPGARKKAKENGYKGAMYPWESAWMDDGEVTPIWGSADIISGESMKIWSGFLEQHITSDIAFAVWQYYITTGDEEFMIKYGYEILLDTGIFWGSRLEWNKEKDEYHINNVIGPDEYKEHVNNDAFTNYTAKWCMENAINYASYLKENQEDIYNRLNKKLNLDFEIEELKLKFDKVYLPQPNTDLVIPQDDTFLSKKLVDLSKYRNQEHVGSVFLDFNLEQINAIQVSKQASVVMLLYLLEHKFNDEIKKANYQYYEPKTLHDSSLSYSTHAILAADVDDLQLSYSLFQKALQIDLGPNMKSSDHGLHAASLGGIWQIVIFGFAGVRMVGGKLRIIPKLPDPIKSISFPLIWQNVKLQIKVTKHDLNIQTSGDKGEVSCEICGNTYLIKDSFQLNY